MSPSQDSGQAAECGDFLLRFGAASVPPAGGRGGVWQDVLVAGAGTLSMRSTSPTWRGAPWQVFEHASGRAFLLGELFGASERHLPEIFAGREGVERLNGHFLLIDWRRMSGEWRIFTNRLGTLHAYCGQRGAKIVASSSFEVARSSLGASELDLEALDFFVRCGFLPGERTLLREIRILRPATLTRFRADGVALPTESTWSWRFRPEMGRDRRDTVDALAGTLTEVMADLTRSGRVALPLSGGLDSRSTLAVLAPERSVWSFSYGYEADSPELAIARSLARKRSLDFQEFVIEPTFLARCDEIADAIEPFQDLTLCRQASIDAELRKRSDAVIAAHWGDVWLDSLGGEGHEGADLIERAAGKITKWPGPPLAERLFSARLGNRGQDLAREAVRAGLARLDSIEDRDFCLKVFKTENWSFRFTTASLRAYQAATFPRLPFYDNRLVDFFQSVPSSFHRGRGLQIDFLKRHAPDLAWVRWQETGSSLFLAPWARWLFLPERALRRLGRRITRRPIYERNWEAQFLAPDQRRALSARLLKPGLRLHEFQPAHEIEELLARLAPGAGGIGYQVSMLLSLSIFLERL